MVSRGGRLVAFAGLLFVFAIASSQCSRTGPSGPQTASAPVTQTVLIGPNPMSPVVSVKELMEWMIDPISDNIFDAVKWESTSKGIIETKPKTDEDWEKVKVGAITLAEGIFLLKVPRPFAPAGDVNNSTGPNPPELSPTQIKEKIDKDPVLWDAKIQGFRNAALEIFEIAKKKDADTLFEASADVDEACEACHLEYWYPGDKAAVDEWKKAKAYFDKPGAAKKP